MKRRPQRLLVYGHYGHWNAGDEAILFSLLAMIEDTAPGTDVQVVCGSLSAGAADWYREIGATVFSIRRVGRLIAGLLTRRLVVGGGQMLAGDRSLKGLLLCLAMLAVNRLAGRRPVLVGIGAEGLDRPAARFVTRLLGFAAGRIACRDEHTLGQFRRAGCSEKKLERTADIVLSGVLDELYPPERGEPSVLVAVHHSPLRRYAGREECEAMVAAARRAAPDLPVVVVGHDNRRRFDAGLLDEMRSVNQDERVSFVGFANLPELLTEYGRARLVVGCRMHPLVFAAARGVPFVACGKSGKTADFATRFGGRRSAGFERLDELISTAMHDETTNKPAADRIREARRAAWRNAEIATAE